MDHLYPVRLAFNQAIAGFGTFQSAGITMSYTERLEGLEYLCTTNQKIEIFGSIDGTTLDPGDVQTVVASSGVMTKFDHVALPNMTAPFVILKVTELSGGAGALAMSAWLRENITAWGQSR